MNQRQRLAQRLALTLPPKEREELVLLQVRLAKVLSRLWDSYAELLDVRHVLLAAAGDNRSVSIDAFEPGATLQLGDSFARTDPRLVLVDRMKVDAFSDLLGELAASVLEAPALARLELLALLTDLDDELVREISERLDSEEVDTDEFPVSLPERERN